MGNLRLDGSAIRALLDRAAHAEEVPPTAETIVDLLRSLAALVRCDVAFWHWLSLRPAVRTYAYVEDPAMVTFIPELEPWLAHLPEHPIMSGRYGPVVSISDVLSDREFRNTWLYQEVFRIDGLQHEIGVEMPRLAGERNMIVLSRERRDFSDRDHDVLELMRPHLACALRQVHGPPRPLTRRQTEVMDLVADGLSDAQIARRLGLSESTVGKHLEHIYTRTGSHTRVQAALLWNSWRNPAMSYSPGIGKDGRRSPRSPG